MERTLRGIKDTLRNVLENWSLTFEDLKGDLEGLEESFNLLSQKWNLQIIYTLLLKNTVTFSGLKKILGVNSRTSSDKLNNLKNHGYIERIVKNWTASKGKYAITAKG